jgi:hypothetical protein
VVDEGYLGGPISEVGTEIDSRVPTTRTNALYPNRRDFGFRRIKEARHSNIANLGVFKFDLALDALKNPFRHLAPAGCLDAGESRKDGNQSI